MDRYQSLQALSDHVKTQELLARYVEINRAHGNAAVLYPDVAAHLTRCLACRKLSEDLLRASSMAEIMPAWSSDLAVNHLNRLESIERPPSALSLEFEQRVAIYLADAASKLAANPELSPNGIAVYYDTLQYEKANLTAVFTLHLADCLPAYRLSGVIAPRQPFLRYDAYIKETDDKPTKSVDDNRLNFDNLHLASNIDRIELALQIYLCWQPGSPPRSA